jgi:signal transduction histidine kinase
MKPSPPHGSLKASREKARKAPGASRAMVARDESRHRHPDAVQPATRPDAREVSATAATEVERLMAQMREANERLIVAAVHAQNESDDAHSEAAQARTQLDDLMTQLRAANARAAADAEHAYRMAQEAQVREEEYRRLSHRLLTVQDEERRRLALDLHDSTAQSLALLAINLDAIAETASGLDAESRRALAESRSLAEQCARELRTVAYLLHPPFLDETGLVSALRWYVEGFTKRSGIQVVMNLDEVQRLPRPIETAMFRVVQEALTNVHRHTSTTTASIRLTADGGTVVLAIHDHGRRLGGDLQAQRPGTPIPETLGVGIRGMRERISQLNGTFDIEFTDAGTTISVRVPVNRDTT